MLQYCTPSHVWGHVTSSANGQKCTIKRNKETFKTRWCYTITDLEMLHT